MEKDFHRKPIRFISPAQTLQHLGLKEGEKVIDYGCGAGHWTIAAARIVGKSGAVVAIDEDPEMLAMVVGQAKVRGLDNIDTGVVTLATGKMAGQSNKPSDLVIVSNVFHFINEKSQFAENIASLVSDNGKLLFIDWLPKKTLLGPSGGVRVSEELVISTFEKVGLKFACMVEAGSQHFGLVFDHKGDGCGWKQ